MEVVARENTVTVIDHHTRQRTVTEESDPMEVRFCCYQTSHPLQNALPHYRATQRGRKALRKAI